MKTVWPATPKLPKRFCPSVETRYLSKVIAASNVPL